MKSGNKHNGHKVRIRTVEAEIILPPTEEQSVVKHKYEVKKMVHMPHSNLDLLREQKDTISTNQPIMSLLSPRITTSPSISIPHPTESTDYDEDYQNYSERKEYSSSLHSTDSKNMLRPMSARKSADLKQYKEKEEEYWQKNLISANPDTLVSKFNLKASLNPRFKTNMGRYKQEYQSIIKRLKTSSTNSSTSSSLFSSSVPTPTPDISFSSSAPLRRPISASTTASTSSFAHYSPPLKDLPPRRPISSRKGKGLHNVYRSLDLGVNDQLLKLYAEKNASFLPKFIGAANSIELTKSISVQEDPFVYNSAFKPSKRLARKQSISTAKTPRDILEKVKHDTKPLVIDPSTPVGGTKNKTVEPLSPKATIVMMSPSQHGLEMVSATERQILDRIYKEELSKPEPQTPPSINKPKEFKVLEESMTSSPISRPTTSSLKKKYPFKRVSDVSHSFIVGSNKLFHGTVV